MSQAWGGYPQAYGLKESGGINRNMKMKTKFNYYKGTDIFLTKYNKGNSMPWGMTIFGVSVLRGSGLRFIIIREGDILRTKTKRGLIKKIMVNDIREWYWGMILVKDKGKIRKKGGNFKNSNSNAYILGWILSNVNVEITENSSQILQFSYGVFLGSIVILFCVLNITGYLITNYLLEKVELEKKYPSIGKYLNRFRKISLFYIFIDIVVCVYILSLLAYYSWFIILQQQSSL